ncbi:MAG: hypothetical protein K0S33_2493 [Bacteroidetes bacterium]|jgi:hypothetical protein|nr:hypothetical protein [Bacteroidota bacterium]
MNEQEINSEFQKQFGSDPNINPSPIPLPNAVSALVLGIVSAFFGLIWCYWIGSLIGLVCGIIAIVHAKKARALYEASPNSFKQGVLGNVNAGRILGIVGLCLSILGFVVLIIGVVVVLAAGSSHLF